MALANEPSCTPAIAPSQVHRGPSGLHSSGRPLILQILPTLPQAAQGSGGVAGKQAVLFLKRGLKALVEGDEPGSLGAPEEGGPLQKGMGGSSGRPSRLGALSSSQVFWASSTTREADPEQRPRSRKRGCPAAWLGSPVPGISLTTATHWASPVPEQQPSGTPIFEAAQVPPGPQEGLVNTPLSSLPTSLPWDPSWAESLRFCHGEQEVGGQSQGVPRKTQVGKGSGSSSHREGFERTSKPQEQRDPEPIPNCKHLSPSL